MAITAGIAGACRRGGSFRSGLEAAGIHVAAVCDLDAHGLAAAAARMGARQQYLNYEEMLDRAGVDAVIIGTPMQFHVPMAVAALERDIHVLSEVPAGVSLAECKALVQACKASKAAYMMAENYVYLKNNVLVAELVRRGLFGQVYYAEGEYVHELKQLNEETPWRRTWQTGIAGVTYGTHSLGPILQWLPGDRVVRVCCEDAEVRLRDPRGAEYAQMTPVMLCKSERGALLKIRLDMLSDRPHAMTGYHVQGTDGCYESGRVPECAAKIWCRELSATPRWFSIEDVAHYLPEMWKNPPPAALAAGHGGGDYYEILDFRKLVHGDAEAPFGIHQAMDMTLPGLISQQSVLEGGKWLAVPDSRDW
jgi:predicted dehydrogenase